MSVPAGERGTSTVQFVYNGSEIYKLSLDICLHMPKRYTYLIAQPLLNKANRLCECCISANSVFPIKYESDFVRRRNWLMEARALAYTISADITNLVWLKTKSVKEGENSPLNVVKISKLKELSKLINRQIELVSGVINSDDRKYFKD